MCHCFCCCAYLFRKINWHILPEFFPLIFFSSYGYVFFPRPYLPFFSFFIFASFACYMQYWVLFLKQKVVHCVLSFWLVCVMLRSYILMLFQYLWISSQIEPDVTLCYHCMQTLELVQTKNSSHSVRFSSGVLNLSSKV